MRVWMVDDMPERQALLFELAGVTAARSPHAKAALRALRGAEPIAGFDPAGADVWMLDHDMCITGVDEPCPMAGGMYARSSTCRCMDGCGFIRRVTHWVETRGLRWPSVVIVHSANTVRAPEMVQLLHEAGVERVYRLPVGEWRVLQPTLMSLVGPDAGRWVEASAGGDDR